MIKELSELGKRLRSDQAEDKWVHNALKEEPISIEIIISEDGEFRGFLTIEKKLMNVAEAITAKKGKARLLLDKAEEVLCYGGEQSKKKHQLFLDKLDDYGHLTELAPVLAFYKNNRKNGVEQALKEFTTVFPDEKTRKGNIGFRIYGEGKRIHEKDNVRKEIITKYETKQGQLLAEKQKKCALCGESKYPVEETPHGMIKRVPAGQTSGCALVSYNEPAFESYGLRRNENSSICTNCARTYVEGLNWLLSVGYELPNKTAKGKNTIFKYSNRKNFGTDTAVVFWTRENKTLPEIDQLEAPNPDDVAKLIESVATGTEAVNRYLETDYFYSFALSGAAARIAIRDWIESSLYNFRSAIAKWFKDISIEAYDSDMKKLRIRYARLYDLARSCQRRNMDETYDKNDASLSRTAVYLWNAALKNTQLPMWILTKVLQRARLEKNGVTPDQAALIKLILNRNNRGGGFMVAERLEQGHRPVAYICGQVFAKLESIQYAALGDRNAGIRERYFTYAMTSPAAAFGRLFNLNSKHFTKLRSEKPGLAVTLDRELQDLCKDVSIEKFPANFSLEEQGQFAIGYYHQRQKQFSSVAQNKSIEEE